MRRSTVRLFVLIVVLGLLTSGLAFADPAPPSNTAIVTGGIFKEANDKFLSPMDFSELESHVVFLQFDMPSTVGGQGFEIGGSAELAGMYVGAYLNSIIQGVTGALGGNNAQNTTIDQDFLVDGSGLITGKTESTSVQIDYDTTSLNDVRALVGIGPMGIGLRVLQSSGNARGTYTANYTLPGGFAWNGITVGTGAATATSFATYDAAGGLVSLSSDEIALGKDNNSVFDLTASFGMPLEGSDSMEIAVGADLLVGMRNNDEWAARETYSRVVGSGTAIGFVPARKLDGSAVDATADVINDLTGYNFSEASEGNSYLQIAPSVTAEVMMPLKDAMVGIGGATLGVGLPIYSGRYTDNAGVDTRVGGLADSYFEQDVDVVVNPNDAALIQTTTTTTTAWESQDISRLELDLDLEAGVEVTPNDRFRFGVSYMPMVSYSKQTDRFAGEAVEVTVVDNGDGAEGIDDSIDRVTVSRAGFTTVTRNFMVENILNTGAQFFLIPERLRVNLGAQVDNVMINRTITETVTDGIEERTEETAVNATDPTTATFVNTDYQFNTDVRVATDDQQLANEVGTSQVVYDAGLTFFFDESMFLDLRMNGGGDIWNTTEWSLEMTILY